jgi:hypothetical protein
LRAGVFLGVAPDFRLAAIVVATAGLDEGRLALPNVKTNKPSCFFFGEGALQSGDALLSMANA